MNSPEISISSKASPIASVASQPTVAWWSDYLSLTKPRILLMILLTVVMGMMAWSGKQLGLLVTLHALIGTGLIAASASILNQWLEQERDSQMVRTRDRPLPAGRLTSLEVAAFGWITGILGFIYLIVFTNFQATSVGFLTWFSYIWIYTPLKTKTWWNTVVGTLPGALPVLIGWTAAGGRLFGLQGWLLTSIVILWQFPHFMAIAWLYREEYDRAGYRMITNTERTGLVAGWLAVIPAVALIPVSVAALMPSNIVGWVLAFVAVLACLHQIRCSIRFLGERNDLHARRLLIGSLLYLPSMIVIAMINSYF